MENVIFLSRRGSFRIPDGIPQGIVFHKNNNGDILGVTFRFTIELHKDDIGVLNYIKSRLEIGTDVAVYGNSCRFVVVHRQDIFKLIGIFDIYNLNTTKYLDYLDFKRAFILYHKSQLAASLRSLKGQDKTILFDQILKLKNGMNTRRTDYNFPNDHRIIISDY